MIFLVVEERCSISLIMDSATQEIVNTSEQEEEEEEEVLMH